MKIDRKDLLAALERVRPGLANRELIEQSTSFAFLGDRVVTYNDEISISSPVKGLDLEGAVQAEGLYSLLSKIDRDEIEISVTDSEIKIKAGRSTAGLVLESEIRLPIDNIGKIGDWHPVPEGFLDAIRLCHSSCSTDMSRPVLTCVHVDGKSVEASDSFQITKYELKEPVPVDPFLLPASAARSLLQYEVEDISPGEGWIHFRLKDGAVFSTRVFNEEFPNIAGFLEFEGTEITFPPKITQSLERAAIFTKSVIAGHMPSVGVSIESGQMTIEGRGDFGWYRESARIRYTGDPVKFNVGVESFLLMLKQTRKILLGDGRSKISGENWQHLVAIMADDE